MIPALFTIVFVALLSHSRSELLVNACQTFAISRQCKPHWHAVQGCIPLEQIGQEHQSAQQTVFMPAMVIPAGNGSVGPTGDGAIEIEFTAGARMRITDAIGKILDSRSSDRQRAGEHEGSPEPRPRRGRRAEKFRPDRRILGSASPDDTRII